MTGRGQRFGGAARSALRLAPAEPSGVAQRAQVVALAGCPPRGSWASPGSHPRRASWPDRSSPAGLGRARGAALSAAAGLVSLPCGTTAGRWQGESFVPPPHHRGAVVAPRDPPRPARSSWAALETPAQRRPCWMPSRLAEARSPTEIRPPAAPCDVPPPPPESLSQRAGASGVDAVLTWICEVHLVQLMAPSGARPRRP